GQPGDPLLMMLPPHLEAVAAGSIVGSVSRHTQLDGRFCPLPGPTPRLRAISRAMAVGGTFPPVVLYRVHGRRDVHAGHHRVAAALAAGHLCLDALVTGWRPRAEGLADGLEGARVRFALRPGLRSIAFSEEARCDQALAQNHDHR